MALDVEIIKIMVLLWLMAAVTYLAYKYWYRKYCQNRMIREAAGLPTVISGQSHERPNLFARISPTFKPLLPDVCRAGETVAFQITFPSILKTQTNGVELQNQLTSLLSVKIFLQNPPTIGNTRNGGGADLGEIIPVVFEFRPNQDGESDLVLLLKFSVKQSGMYECDVKYSGIQVRGTPYFKGFFPNFVDPESTVLQRKSPAILCVTDVSYFCIIDPKDKHNNLCRIEDVDMKLFSIQITELEPSKKGEPVEPITFNFYQDSNDWGVAQRAVRLQLEIFRPGLFHGTIYYKDCKILNGSFEIVCLNTEENDKFRAILLENPGAAYHEGNLVYLGLESIKTIPQNAKQRKVYIYVAPQVLSVKEYYFGFIPAQLASYRVIPATRIQLMLSKEDTWVLQFTDRMQPKSVVEMNASQARMVTALFQFFLQQRLGGSESFENKQRFFHQELRKVMTDKSRSSSPCVINIHRDQLLESTLKETRLLSGKDWCRKFKIRFVGEAGADEGGLRREWLDLLCRDIFDNNPKGMFKALGNSRLVIPNSQRESWFTLKHYELAGLVVGKCMFETAIGGHFKQMVNARFGRSFLAQIIGFPPHFKYFEKDDPELYESKIKYILDALDMNSMELTFTEEVYKDGKLITVIDLIPNGADIKVTLENKLEYLQALAQYRLFTQVRKEIQAFNKGLNSVVPFGLLTNFDENELEILMCGQSTITVDDMKNHHVVTPCSELHCAKIVAWFWTAMENMTESERSRLLQFTTGSSLLPHGGFQCLEPRFRVTVYGTTGKLPIAHTCFNEICLSNHALFEDFERSLKTAITEGNEGFSFH